MLTGRLLEVWRSGGTERVGACVEEIVNAGVTGAEEVIPARITGAEEVITTRITGVQQVINVVITGGYDLAAVIVVIVRGAEAAVG